MKHNLLKSALVVLAAVFTMNAGQAVVKVHTIGDSTMQDYDESTTPTRGWATYLGSFFDSQYVTVNNRGKAGTSSRTFYTGAAYWTSVKSQMSTGDYVIIQFAHNDENNNGMDALEYNAYLRANNLDTLTDLRGTTPQTTYKAYLRKFVNETRALGCNPILMGPICRFWFSSDTVTRAGQHDLGDKFSKLDNGTYLTNQSVPVNDNSMDYLYAMQEVATELNVPFIDLTTASKQIYNNYGDPTAKNLMGNGEDGTHLGAMGANLVARQAAQLLKNAGILAQYISIPTAISASPNALSIGEVYTGVAAQREFLLTGYGLNPATGNVTITTSGNLSISTDGTSFAQSKTVAYEGNTLFQKVYVRALYTTAGEASDNVVVTSGNTNLTVPVTASVISLDGGSTVSATWPLTSTTDLAAQTSGPVAAQMSMSSMCAWSLQSGFIDGDETISMVRFHNADAGGSKTAWPAGEIDENESRYLDFAVTAPTTMDVHVTNINMVLAGNSTNTMCCHINAGLGDAMSGVTTIYERKNFTNNAVVHVALTPVLTIPAGETLHIRILPWHDSGSASNGKYICVKDVVIEGQAFEAEAPDPSVIPFSMAEEATHKNTPDGWTAVALPTGLPTFTAANTFYIDAYGASTSSEDNTAAIQAALDAVPSTGGMVVIPAGEWLCGPIQMGSKTVLHLCAGATLKLLPIASFPTNSDGSHKMANPFITGKSGASDIVIEGESRETSIIDGQGAPWWDEVEDAGKSPTRSALIRFWQGERYLFRNFRIQNAPNTNITIGKNGIGANATVHDVTIKNPASNDPTDPSHNTDGIPVWTQYVNIYDCDIDTGDDNVVCDSQSQFVHVWNCDFKAGHGASIGSYTVDLHHIIYEGITFTGTDCGFRLKSNRDRSGDVHDIIFRNCTMTGVESPIVITSWYDQLPSGGPSAAATAPDDSIATTPYYHNILIKDVTVSGHTTYKSSEKNYYGIFIYGRPECKVRDVTFDNVNLTHSKGVKLNFCENINFQNCSIEVSNTNNTGKNGSSTAAELPDLLIEQKYQGAFLWNSHSQSSKAILSWYLGANGADATAANSITGATGSAAEGFTIAITGNTTKNWSAGNGSINYNATNYKTLKNSNGAQNTVTLPDGMYAHKVEFYAVANHDTDDGRLSEFNGSSCDDAVSSHKDYSNPTYIAKEFTTGVNSFTFTFSTKQVCFIAVVTYSDSETADPEPTDPTSNYPITAKWDFQNLVPASLADVNIQGTKEEDVASDVDGVKMHVISNGGKLQYNSSGYAQFNTNTTIQVPVLTTTDVVTVVSYPGQSKYTVGGEDATGQNTFSHTATAAEVAQGYVEIVPTSTAYLYSIQVVQNEPSGSDPTPAAGYTNTWQFGKSNGAEEFALQHSAEYTYTVNEHSLVINTDAGKLNNASRNDQWAQCNNGTTFKIPAFEGAKLSWGRYAAGSETGFTVGEQLFNAYYIATAEETTNISAYGINYLSFIKVEPVAMFEITGTVSGGDINGKTVILTANGNGQKYSATVAENAFSLKVPADTYSLGLGSDVAFVVSDPASVVVSAAGNIGTVTIIAAMPQTVTGTIVNAPAEAFVLTFTGSNNSETVNCEAGATSYTTSLAPDTYVISSSVGTLSPLSVESFTVVNAAVSHNIYYPEAAVPAATQQNITVDNTATVAANVYNTLTDALAAAKAGNIASPIITLTSGQTYREQVIVDIANVTLRTSGEEKATITFYYGIGYAYYSLAANGYYDKDRAMTRNSIKMIDPARWGATVLVKSTGNGFKAENIIFENSFNQYYTTEEVLDGVRPNGVQAITYNRTLVSGDAGFKAADAKDVTERAAAIAFENNPSGCQLYNCVFRGSQDTYYTSGKIYMKNCNIIGNTDYIFGGGYVVFDDCDLTIGGYSDKQTSAYITAYKDGNTLDASKKYVFRNCTVKAADRAYVAANLGRDWGGAAASVYFFNLKNEIGDKLSYSWTNMGGGVSDGTADLHIYDFDGTVNANYSTTGPTGANVNGLVSHSDAYYLYTGVVTSLGFTPEHIYDIPLDENSYYNSLRIVASHTGTGVATLTRSIAADKWSTIVLPFDIAASDIEAIFGAGAVVAELTDGDATNLNFSTTLTDSKMKANQPYAIKVAADFAGATVADVTFKAETATQSVTNWEFQGKYLPSTIPAGSYFFSNNQLWQASDATNSIKPFRAYFTYSGTSAAPQVNFSIDGESQATGIEAVEAEDIVKFMENGVLYIMREGVVYDAMGRVVR